MWIGVLWAGLRVAMWITHVGVEFRHGLLEKSLIVAYGKFGLVFFFCLQLKFGLVFIAYGGIRKLGLVFLLTVPPVRKLDLVLSAYGSPTVSKKDEP